MPTSGNEFRRQAIRSALLERSGSHTEPAAVAEATVTVWQQMAGQLAPMIGARGVDVLFSRALHLTSRAFPWLSMAEQHGGARALPASLKECLAARDSAQALEAGHALLVTFSELLASLIGDSLTERLLQPVWATHAAVAEQESR